jgi:hypothetical protein
MATDPFIQRHIRNLPLFARLTAEQIDAVARIAEVVQLQPGQIAFQQGQPTRGLMLFVAGRGVLTRLNANNIEEPIGAVEAGQYINESALYTTTRENASLRIVQPAVILLIPRGRFVQLLAHDSALRVNLRVETAPDQRETARTLFKGQRDNETVLHIYRRHWWAFGRWLWIPAVIGIALFVGAVALAGMNAVLALAAGGLGIIIPGVIIAYMYYEWQDDSVIVTNQRVVRIWKMLFTFENTINEIPLERILETNAEIPPGDAFARLLNYGTVAIKTSGENANLLLDFMPQPMQVQRMIFAQRDQFQQANAQRRQEQIRADIERALGRAPAAQGATTGAPPVVPLTDDSHTSVGISFLRTRFLSVNGEIIYRKHVSVWLMHILPGLLVVFGGIALLLLSFMPAFTFAGAAGIGLGLAVLLIGGLWMYWGDWDWRNDLFILGRDAITLIRKRPLFLQNQRDTIRLTQVDNVRSDVNGILNTLLNRGNVYISLIGAESNAKMFDAVYDPQSIQSEISQRLSAIRAAQAQANTEQQRQQMLEYFAVFQQVTGRDGRDDTLTQPAPTSQARPYTPAAPPDEPTVPTDQPPPPHDANRPPRIPRTRPGG